MSAPNAYRFDELAATYDEPAPFFAMMGERLDEWMDPAAGQHLLDLGAGRGAVSMAVSHRLGAARELVVGDVSIEMLKHLRALSLPGARVCSCDATAIDEPDG